MVKNSIPMMDPEFGLGEIVWVKHIGAYKAARIVDIKTEIKFDTSAGVKRVVPRYHLSLVEFGTMTRRSPGELWRTMPEAERLDVVLPETPAPIPEGYGQW
jgi:hypothetical protein